MPNIECFVPPMSSDDMSATMESFARRTPNERTGYASIIILMLFLGGVIITILGMIGEYLARIYMEVKRRPIYFERESNIDDNALKEETK